MAGLFQPYPPASFPEVYLCKGGMKWGSYDRSNFSFSQLYFNMFVNLAGQKREERVRLRIDKESFFEVYKVSGE